MKHRFITSLFSTILLSATAVQADTPAPGLNLTLPRAKLIDAPLQSQAPGFAHANATFTNSQGRLQEEGSVSEPRQRADLPYGSGYEARRAASTRSMNSRGMGRGRGR